MNLDITLAILEDKENVRSQIRHLLADFEASDFRMLASADLHRIPETALQILFVHADTFLALADTLRAYSHRSGFSIIAYHEQPQAAQVARLLQLDVCDCLPLQTEAAPWWQARLQQEKTRQEHLKILQKEKEEQEAASERLAEYIRKRTKYFVGANEALKKEVELRREQEESLRKTLQRLSSHFDNSPLAVIEWDRNYRILQWSKQAEKMFGWQAEELLGKAIPTPQFTHSEDEPSVVQRIEKLFNKTERQNISINRNFTKAGATIFCEWYNSALYADDGEVDTILSIVNDVSASKRYEEELLASQERFQKLSQASFDAIVIHDNGVLIDCNTQYLQMFQRSLEECLGANTLDFFTEESKAIIQSHIESQNEAPYEIVGIRKDGSTFPVEVVAKTIQYNHKEVRLGALRDITLRKRTEEVLVESEERFRSTFEQAAVGLAHITLEGQILRVNQKLAQLCGYDKEELLLMPIRELIDTANIEEDLLQIQKLVQGASDLYRTEKQIIHRKGKRVWVNLTLSCVLDAQQQFKYFTVVCEDITQRKKAEYELKQAHQELDKFVYNASHDLRGPIASLLGLCEIALLEVQDAQAKHYLDMIEETAQKMSIILSSLLLVNDIKKRRLQIEEIDFQEIFEQFRQQFAPEIAARNAKVEAHIQAHFAFHSDRELVERLLGYLFANALQFYKLIDSEALRIALKVEAESNNHITIKVQDTGIGIPKHLSERVFDMFFRGTERSKGVGLGLYMAKTIVNKLGGKIYIDYTYTEGTCLVIKLPNLFVSKLG
jgi:PAS domain S-box-containing protein